jgi:hypothetical protein
MTTATGARGAAPPQPRYPGLGTPPHTIHTRPQRPAPAEARGKLRVWRAAAARAAAKVEAAFEGKAAAAALADYTKKRGLGRARALRHLRACFEPAARYQGDLGWAYLSPRGNVYDTDDPSLSQRCVLVGQIAVARGELRRRPLWTVEFTDHALARYFERNPGGDLADAIWDAHGRVLGMGQTEVLERAKAKGDRRFLVPAGPGAFSAELVVSETIDGKRLPYIRATTWLHRDQLSEHQETDEIAATGRPGDRLGELVLQPRLPVPAARR